MNDFRLYKSTTDKKISGVCGGLAETMGIDPSIIRIIWALVTFFYGFGLILYIIAAIVLPEGKPGAYRRPEQPNSNNYSNNYSNNDDSPETKAYDVNYKEVNSFDDVQQ